MTFIKSALFLFIFSISAISHAQILNAEEFRLDEDSSNLWVGNAEFGFSAKKQQTDVFTVSSKANTAYLTDKHSYMFLGYLNVVKVASSNVISEGYGHVRFNFLRRKIFSLEQFNQLQFDQGRGMKVRGLLGANLRFRIKSNDRWEFAVNSGLMYEDELWEGTNGLISNVNVKSTTSGTWRYKISKVISVFMIAYYQARFDQFFKPRFISDSSLQINLTSKFFFRAQYVATFDAAPIIENNKLIYNFSNTLGYNF